jgi:formate-dependent nitrite reductase cytochrome c552 subunit
MRCLACNVELTDNEAKRKFANHEEIKNPEDKYICLCNNCLSDDDDFVTELVGGVYE